MSGTSLRVLGAFVIACLLTSLAGAAVTSLTVDTWYPTLAKPPLTPPDWLFAPVWTALFAGMAVAGWRVWERAPAAARREHAVWFAGQLALNLLWSCLFFGLTWVTGALVEIVALLGVLVRMARAYGRVDRWAGAVFAVYALWVAFATYLTAGIWLLNR